MFMKSKGLRIAALLLLCVLAFAFSYCRYGIDRSQRFAREIAVAESFLSQHAWGLPVTLLAETARRTEAGVQISVQYADVEEFQVTVSGDEVSHNLSAVIAGKKLFLRVSYDHPWANPLGEWAEDVCLTDLYNTPLRITEVDGRGAAFNLAGRLYWLPLCAFSEQPAEQELVSELFVLGTETSWWLFPHGGPHGHSLKKGMLCRSHIVIHDSAFVSFISGPPNTVKEQGWVSTQALIPLADALSGNLSSSISKQASNLVQVYLAGSYKELEPEYVNGTLSQEGVSFDASIKLGSETVNFRVVYDGVINDTLTAELSCRPLYARQSLGFPEFFADQEGEIRAGEQLTVSAWQRSDVMLAHVQSASGRGWIPLWSCTPSPDDVSDLADPIEMIIDIPVSFYLVPMHGKLANQLPPGLVVQATCFHDQWAFVQLRCRSMIENPGCGWLPREALRDFDVQYSREAVIRPGTILYEGEEPGEGDTVVISQDEIVFIVEEKNGFALVERMFSRYWVSKDDVTRCNPWRITR